MAKTFFKILISILSFTFYANAETISGNCFIFDKPFGENQFQLNPGTTVDCSIPQKGWCMILFKAFIEKKYVYDGIKILANARIKNENGKNIGRVFADMNPYRTITENDTCFIMEIAGYIEAGCIFIFKPLFVFLHSSQRHGRTWLHDQFHPFENSEHCMNSLIFTN